jgi:hypothetical protein
MIRADHFCITSQVDQPSQKLSADCHLYFNPKMTIINWKKGNIFPLKKMKTDFTICIN